MQSVLQPAQTVAPQSQKRPILDSYDSGEEFSFYHWIEVRKLVDDEEVRDSSDLENLRKPVRATAVLDQVAKHA